jgi:RNA polymerase sigma-70 factor (ECF subfamily)
LGDIWNSRVRSWETDRNQDEWSFVFRTAKDAPKEAHRAWSMSEGGQADVYRVAYGIIGRRNGADEVAQEVFAKAYFFIKRFDGLSSLYAWVYRLAVNECYGFLRRKPRGAVDSDDSASPGAVVDGIGSRRDFLNKLLDRIPEENRYLLLLRELEGYSVARLAEATGLNENTIKMKLLWMRQALAKSARQYRCTS